MGHMEDSTQREHPHRFRLFDQDGLPWTSRLRWGLLLVWAAVISFAFTPIIGIYLGVWLITKGRSGLTLILYLALTVLLLGAFLDPFAAKGTLLGFGSMIDLSAIIIWFATAFNLRHEVIAYYSTREGVPFRLNPALTALFGPWYIGGRLRADFPLDAAGKAGPGVLKLIV